MRELTWRENWRIQCRVSTTSCPLQDHFIATSAPPQHHLSTTSCPLQDHFMATSWLLQAASVPPQQRVVSGNIGIDGLDIVVLLDF
ncbi:MAG TPA: hypothetical protein PLX49_13210, partial [Prolixibacteraceae bacterium]|nr:hypothetical protein [Prolixibacteraceae bacterium]